MGCCSPQCALRYHIAMAVVGLLAGLISFFVFDFYYHNYHAGENPRPQTFLKGPPTIWHG